MTKPTCEDIWNESGFDEILREDDASWRHGSYRREVHRRIADQTYWEVNYRISTDGETNELREGTAEICEVVPVEKTVTAYVPKVVANA